MSADGTPKIALHDVEDVGAFVNGTLHAWVKARGVKLGVAEREELVGEGIAIMAKLAADYEPHRDGYEQAGSFAGYAAEYLPKRLTTAWHRLNEHHSFRANDEGGRSWVYGNAAVSLDAIIAPEDDHPAPASADDPALRVEPEPAHDIDFSGRLRAALHRRAHDEAELAWQVGEMLARDMSELDVRDELGIRAADFEDCVERLRVVARQLTTTVEEAAA